MAHLFSFSVVLLLIMVTQSSAECEPFLGQPNECVSLILTPNIESPPGGNQTTYAQTASQILPVLNTIDPQKCGPTTLVFACNNYFRPCPTNSSDPVQAGARVCRSLCLKLLEDCGAVFTQFGSQIPPGLIPNCSAIDSTGIAVFPDGLYDQIGSDGLTYTRQCNPGSSINASKCVPPLVAHLHEAVVCQPPCPRRFYSPSEMKAQQIVLSILAMPTFLADVLMVALILLTPSRRRWPSVVPCFMFLGNSVAVIGFLIGWFGGFNNVWCVGVNFARQNHEIHPSCVAGAIFFIYGLQVFVLWWMWQAILIFEMVIFPMVTTSRVQQYAAHVTSWGLPLIVIIIAGATQSYGYAGDAPVCFFRVDSKVGDYLFWYPIMALTCIIVPLLFVCVIRLASTGGWRAVGLQWRLLLMMFYSITTYTMFCAFKLDLDVSDKKYKSSLGAYITCIGSGNGVADCTFLHKPPYSLHLAFFILWELTGIVNAMICGLDREFVATVMRLRKAGSLTEFFRDSLSGSTSGISRSAQPGQSSMEVTQTQTQTQMENND